MEYRQLGESGLSASAITFGAWAIGGWMWGGAERKDAVDAIRASYDQGVTSIDTAPIYGQGLSEEIVGEALTGIPRDKVQIMTKYGMRWDEKKGEFGFRSQDNDGRPLEVYKYAGKDSIVKECEDSLRRLRTDHIDLYQIHWPDSTTPVEETMEAVGQLLKQGKIRAAGVSNYNVELMERAEKTLSLASDQVPFSMVNRGIEKDLVPWCIRNKKAILAYSPLQRGLLTGKIRPGHLFGEGDTRAGSKFYKPENVMRINAFLDQLRSMAEARSASLAQLVIRWTLERPGITIALVGARDATQAVQNARAIDVKLSPEEILFINRHLEGLELVD
ncbi:aldo/keto reductase [Flavitalea sp. BT771]|uniref:aldo/keto reductase n=1 Tax=Flavitalea sp. BT771 TaxID=3063329 RepID=UPI0026E27F66|nr:aldo/keto reductase [Flavitalea sp. BT771]MDO6432435.1 aldo/keto reductase [Flavitalea sp. BT771]MDV6221345.1 aldo/keto reductase [Flavitalea sp. BT771]